MMAATENACCLLVPAFCGQIYSGGIPAECLNSVACSLADDSNGKRLAIRFVKENR